MAYLPTAAIHTRLREVLTSAAGTLRTITANTYSRDLPENLDDPVQARKAVEKPLIEPRFSTWRRSPSSPPVIGNLAIYEAECRVRVVRVVDRTAQIDASSRDTANALAAADCDVLAQALGFPGNLTTTAAGTATNIVSGCMVYQDSTSDVRGPVADGASIIETDHRFLCRAYSSPATS